MKFNFKIQQYQTDAVDSVVSVFKGQPYSDPVDYRRDIGRVKTAVSYSQMSFVDSMFEQQELTLTDDYDDVGFKNEIVALPDAALLANIREIQQNNNVKLSDRVINNIGRCSLDVEMETGTGKTYVYIKTMYELNKHYGWSKFIVVVPSIAIREGVRKSFEITQEHFMEQYGKKVRFFVYNSSNLNQLDAFSSNSGINVIRLIKEQKATMIVEHISYDRIEGRYESTIFTAEKHTSFDKAYRASKHIQDYVFTDGTAEKSVERKFAEELDGANEVCVYAKLPKGFAISTPVGSYSPDWAIAFYEGTVKHIYFIAETKGTMESLELRTIEKAKISCARKLFNEISTENVVYHDVDSYQSLLNIMNSIEK